MAGREVSGYDNSLNNLFDNASFICTPVDAPRRKVDALIGLAEDMGSPAQCDHPSIMMR